MSVMSATFSRGGQAGDQIVELKDEADVVAAIASERRVVELGELLAAIDKRCRLRGRRARPGC